MIVQVGAKAGRDRLRDLGRREIDGALSERVAGERRSRNAASLLAVEERLDLAIAVHALGETGPAGALALAFALILALSLALADCPG